MDSMYKTYENLINMVYNLAERKIFITEDIKFPFDIQGYSFGI